MQATLHGLARAKASRAADADTATGICGAVVGFLTGYLMGWFEIMMLVYAGGVVITTLITVPNWPWFNRHPLNWLDPSEAEKLPKPQPQQPLYNLNLNFKRRGSKK